MSERGLQLDLAMPPAESDVSLPVCGPGEGLFFANFHLEADEGGPAEAIEGVVAASDRPGACSLLLSAVAQVKLISYSSLRRRARFPEAWRISPHDAARRITAGARPVSMWKPLAPESVS